MSTKRTSSGPAGGKGGTPAVVALEAAGIAHTVHRYEHDKTSTDFGAEAVGKMAELAAAQPGQIFKTLVVRLDSGRLAVAVVPVPVQLSLKAAAKALGASKAVMADAAAVTRSSGYVLGGVSPVGQKTALPTVVDASALEWDTICVSAGKRGLEIEVAPGDLVAVTGAIVADIAAD
ncbi:MAG: Cys-tRNA(Pro) deacylase [Gordonia sp. (in: high G+C Gram-positive bacteria)]|uniref:Cys-tRNA(Pro) deacylase n=1 Tax=Gordonia sp. (in: high G+C Gram-positive bacteria) TaxID=84139 RepID=UPI0039E29099